MDMRGGVYRGLRTNMREVMMGIFGVLASWIYRGRVLHYRAWESVPGVRNLNWESLTRLLLLLLLPSSPPPSSSSLSGVDCHPELSTGGSPM